MIVQESGRIMLIGGFMSDKQLRIIDNETGEIVTQGMSSSATGLTLDPNTPYEQWENIGEQLNQIEGAIQWWIGDWLNFGERKYGEMYAQAVSESEVSTWQNYKYTSNAVESARRRELLSWSHHREVASLPPDEQEYWLEKAETEGMTRNELRHAIKRKKIEDAAQLPSGKYRVLYADPPWAYGNTMPDYMGVQDDHYPTMTVDELCQMPIYGIADDNAVLFLWVTSPILAESFQLIEAWGFEYKTSFVWDKVKHVMGHYNSVRHELLLVCVRGSCQPDVQKLFDSVVTEERTEHSKKPEIFREIIDTIYPYGKRIELFARETAEGWDVYGNEV
jgi:N6-adenosine-specific RNA methylase IME4